MAAITAPETLTKSRHWVVHRDKAPTGRDGMTGWNLADNWFSYDEALKMLERRGYDGIGYIVARESGRKDRQIIGGDLDNCRDPITGEGSAWAKKILDKLNTASGPSFTGTGYRWFCLGKLPDGINEITGHGADDLTDEMKEHIMAAKPSVRIKLAEYGPAETWNGLEVYEDGPKHLTVAGQWLPEYPVDLQDRQIELNEVISPYLSVGDEGTPPRERSGAEHKTSGSRFSHLNILDVIDTNGFSASGDELVGTHPGIGSATGANLKVNAGKNTWCDFHNGRGIGGDPWVFLACECGAVRWEDAGPGVLNDPVVVSKTMMHAAKRGLIPETPEIVAAYERATREKIPTGPTVIDAIKALAGVCDGAATKDGCGFSKFDRETHNALIEKALSSGDLSKQEEKKAYAFLRKYKKQLKGLGIDYDQVGHIAGNVSGEDNKFAQINERIPGWIAEHHFKTVTDTERLYHYADGVYLDDGEIILKELIESEFGDVTDNKLVADIIGKVKRRTYIDRELFNNRPIVNVRNGLLDLDTLQLLPHTPDYLSTAQIDVLYNPEATSPHIQKFLSEVAQSGDVALIEEIIGWLLWPDYNVHKAVMLLGPGRNGKGTLLRLITAFLGKKSISNVTLQDLIADRFAKADLYGKLANIGGDLPSKDLSDTAAFRNLTGGDDNRAQEKYRPAFNFRNKAKMLFSANVLPRSPDDTYAFYSRWILIEFLRVFDAQKGTGDPDLDAKLQTPEELSGLLNLALAGLKRLRAAGWKFSYDKSVEDVEVMYKRNANPVYAFLLDECEAGAVTDYIEKNIFYSCFKDYATSHSIRPLSSKKFSELLKDQTEVPVSSARPGSGWDRPLCWQGITFRDGSKSKEKVNGVTSSKSWVTPTPSSPVNKNEREEKEKKNEGKVGITQTHDFDDVDPHPRRDEPTPSKKNGDFSADEAALLKRICGRMRQQHPDKPINVFELAVLMRSNELDIGIERCKEWIELEAGA